MTTTCPRCGNLFDPITKWTTKTFCSRSCSNARNHTAETRQKISKSAMGRRVDDTTKQKISNALIGREAQWNKTRTVTEETRNKLRQANTGKVISDTTRQKMSINAKRRNLGGHTSKRKIWYERVDGSIVYLQSGYEVLLAQLLDRLGIWWERPDPLQWVDSNGVDHRYYPDFKVGTIYIDTKNDYLIVKDTAKIAAVIEQNNVTLLVLTLDMITEEYITSVV